MRLVANLEEIEKQGLRDEKEIERAKFHEERGKVGCDCWLCQQQKEAQKELAVKKEREREVFLKEGEEDDLVKCVECMRKVKKSQRDEEADACKRCAREFSG